MTRKRKNNDDEGKKDNSREKHKKINNTSQTVSQSSTTESQPQSSFTTDLQSQKSSSNEPQPPSSSTTDPQSQSSSTALGSRFLRSLPMEISRVIFSYLSLSDLGSLTRASKDVNALVGDPYFWDRLVVEVKSDVALESLVASIAKWKRLGSMEVLACPHLPKKTRFSEGKPRGFWPLQIRSLSIGQ